MKPKLLIVDDDEDIRSQMRWALAKEYDIRLAEDRGSALAALRESRAAVVLLDLGLPPHPSDPTEGLAALPELLSIDRQAKVIVVTGQAEKVNALEAIGQGAYDFLCKPVQMDELKVILRRAFHVARLEREFVEMQASLRREAFEGMLGSSACMQDVFTAIRKVATTDAPVLILGESGTGKEIAAQAIHRHSARKDGPFAVINCGAIPENLLESELFGHEKGAFTGAHVQRQGRIETANSGTLFLDEVGELPLALQVKLLRFLQEQTIERVGGRSTIQIDARVIAATNVDLKKALEAGTFREDLYYRLAVVVVDLPPLRAREDDIALLAQAFLQRFAAENGKQRLRFDQRALRALRQHSWPGNIRELENRVKRAVIMADGSTVATHHLELQETAGAPSVRTLKEAKDLLELEMIQQALKKHQGRVSRAAAELGVSRPTLYELMDKYSIKRTVTE